MVIDVGVVVSLCVWPVVVAVWCLAWLVLWSRVVVLLWVVVPGSVQEYFTRGVASSYYPWGTETIEFWVLAQPYTLARFPFPSLTDFSRFLTDSGRTPWLSYILAVRRVGMILLTRASGGE